MEEQKIDADYRRLLGYKIQGQKTIKEREDRKHAIERFMRESLMWLNFLCYELDKCSPQDHERLVEERNYHEKKLVEYVLSEIEITK